MIRKQIAICPGNKAWARRGCMSARTQVEQVKSSQVKPIERPTKSQARHQKHLKHHNFRLVLLDFFLFAFALAGREFVLLILSTSMHVPPHPSFPPSFTAPRLDNSLPRHRHPRSSHHFFAHPA